MVQVVALITIEVHARDVIEKLGKVGCTNANDFEWVSQLRFYWDKEQNDCIVKQVWIQALSAPSIRITFVMHGSNALSALFIRECLPVQRLCLYMISHGVCSDAHTLID